MAGDNFEIQLIRSLESADDAEAITSILDDLEASPTSITFLSMNMIQNVDSECCWCKGYARYSSVAEPSCSRNWTPSTGGLWGIAWGEELTEEDPLAQRYIAKDPTPHIEAEQNGFTSNYTALTYLGSYAYDAVLAAASGLAMSANISDGEEVLNAIRGLSLNLTNTGNLEMDEHGDRVGARIPIYFIKPNGKAEQFAVYYDNTVHFLQDPLWPGGSTVQPADLIRKEMHYKLGSYWSDSDRSCLTCPSLGNITFSEENLAFEGVSAIGNGNNYTSSPSRHSFLTVDL
jgi:hypothetical protein